MPFHIPREVEVLDPELWDLPRRLIPADCRDETGTEGRRLTQTHEPEDDR